jgi:hypothetical protein
VVVMLSKEDIHHSDELKSVQRDRNIALFL